MKKLLSFIVVLVTVLSLGVFVGCGEVEDEQGGPVVVDGLTIENGVVTKYEPTSDSGVELVIPEKANGIYVSEIAKEVFKNCDALKTVTIPVSMKKIGKKAFYGCTNLEGVYITDVAGWAGIEFDEMYANPIMNDKCEKLYVNGVLLEELKFPEYVTRIERYAFYMCISIKKITVSRNITFIGKYAFAGLTSTLEQFVFEQPKGWTGGTTVPFTALQKSYPIPGDTGWGSAISCYNHFKQYDWTRT